MFKYKPHVNIEFLKPTYYKQSIKISVKTKQFSKKERKFYFITKINYKNYLMTSYKNIN